MNKQLVQDIIKAGNKAMDVVHIKYTVDTKDNRYYSYCGLYYDDKISLSYEDIVGIRIGDV